MANREELAVIRSARAGRVGAQLELGKLYLFGSAGLPRSLPTALHWLDRAAQQDCAEAWQLIGSHIPLELAQQSPRPVAAWYERAWDDGSARAALVYAQLVLAQPGPPRPAARARAERALEDAARAGFAEAQWLLARQHGASDAAADTPSSASGTPGSANGAPPAPAGQRWLRRAADSGVAEARFAVLEQDWAQGNHAAYLARALPLARAAQQALEARGRAGPRLAPDEVRLLSRCARAAAAGSAAHDLSAAELQRFWELAGAEHDRHAQLALGLWHARMQVDGKRVAAGAGSANFKKATRWLVLAGEQGLPEAWYALSRIYLKPEFSQRNVADAQKYLQQAADMGYRAAQLECGLNAWRARRENENNDVRAIYWLQKAAGQGCAAAAAALRRIAPRPEPPARMATVQLAAGAAALADTHPLLAARLELAALFRLSRAEALLLDVKAADHGHCLVVDIRASYGRSKRRLVVVETAQERQALDRIVAVFDSIDCGPTGPEGNYRQRLYRLRTLLGAAPREGLDFSIAA